MPAESQEYSIEEMRKILENCPDEKLSVALLLCAMTLPEQRRYAWVATCEIEEQKGGTSSAMVPDRVSGEDLEVAMDRALVRLDQKQHQTLYSSIWLVWALETLPSRDFREWVFRKLSNIPVERS